MVPRSTPTAGDTVDYEVTDGGIKNLSRVLLFPEMPPMTIMTRVTIKGHRMTKPNRVWTVAQAKANLSAVVGRALTDGPQTITRSGREVVVVVSVKDWERRAKPKGNIVDFFASSPLRGARLRIQRSTVKSREK
jgi:prevent-host-death family protein